MVSKVQLAGVLFLTGTLFLVGGCGKKTAPVPPDAIVPKAIEDLRYSVNEKGVTLDWTFPKETIKGTDLSDITTFDVYRAVVPVADYCATCPIPFSEAVVVPGGIVDPENDRRGSYETALLRSGHKYFFKVNARTSWWAASGDSNIVSFVWHTPAKKPEGVLVDVADSSVVVSWQQVSQLLDGQTTDYSILYQVQRSQDGKNFVDVGTPVSDTRFMDAGLTNGVTYSYQVQSVLMVAKDAVTGGVSDVVNGVPVDLQPPESPTGITVVQTADGIKVFWDKSRAADVKGYKVYRRAADEQQSKAVGNVSAVYSIFEDTDVAADTGYFYTITAYDTADPANESDTSREVGVRH